MVRYPCCFLQTTHHICFYKTISHHRWFTTWIVRQSRRLVFWNLRAHNQLVTSTANILLYAYSFLKLCRFCFSSHHRKSFTLHSIRIQGLIHSDPGEFLRQIRGFSLSLQVNSPFLHTCCAKLNVRLIIRPPLYNLDWPLVLLSLITRSMIWDY